MNGLLKGALAVGGGAVAAEVLWRALGARARDERGGGGADEGVPDPALNVGGGCAGQQGAGTLSRVRRGAHDGGGHGAL